MSETQALNQYQYNPWMRLMHWGSGVLFLFNLFLGILLANTKYLQGSAFNTPLHKSFGLLVFFLVILRIIVRTFSNLPKDIESLTPFFRLASKVVHFCLYGLLVAIPTCGWLMSSLGGRTPSFFGLFNMPNLVGVNKELGGLFYQGHMILSYCALALVGMHIVGTFIHKENILKRML
jgi:cytochrome b561